MFDIRDPLKPLPKPETPTVQTVLEDGAQTLSSAFQEIARFNARLTMGALGASGLALLPHAERGKRPSAELAETMASQQGGE